MPENVVMIDGLTYKSSDPIAQAYLAKQEPVKQPEPPKEPEPIKQPEPTTPTAVDYITIGGINYRTTDPVAIAYMNAPNAPSYQVQTRPVIPTAETIKETTLEKEVSIESEEAKKYYPEVRKYIEQSGGNLAYYNSLDEQNKQIYIQQLQDTQSMIPMDIEQYVSKTGGNVDYYNTLPEEDKQTYLEQLQTTREMDIQDFIEKSGGDYNYYNELPTKDKPTYINQLIATQEMDVAKYDEAKQTLAPFVATNQWQQITESGELVNPSYDLASITQQDIKNNPQIVNAVATLFPDYDTSKLGVKYVDINQYKFLGQVVPQNGVIPEAGVQFYDEKLEEYVIPRVGLTINDYYDKIRSGQSAEEVIRLYFPIVTLTEYEDYDKAKLAELGVVVRPTIQEITKEMSGIDTTKELTSTDAAKLFGMGFSVPFQVVVPFVATGVGLATKKLSGGWLGVSLVSDALSMIPLVRAVSLGARAVSTAGRLARASAIAEAVGQELIANIKAPFTMLAHPIATIQSGGRTVVDQFENVFSKAKINEAVITTADYTVRIRIGVDMTEAEALVARDAIVEAGRASGKDIHIQLLNEIGEVVSEVNVPRSALMKEVGGAVVHNTPMGEVYKAELEATGVAKVGVITATEGIPIKDKLFISLEPHPRFTGATAGGITGQEPTIMIWNKDSNVAKAVEQGTKTWKHTYEVEGTIPQYTVLWEKEPAQVLFTRIGPNRTKTFIWLDSPLSDWQLLKLKVLGIIEGVKAPFKQPITFDVSEGRLIKQGEELNIIEGSSREVNEVIKESVPVELPFKTYSEDFTIKQPELAAQEGRAGKIVYMTPDEYLKLAAKIQKASLESFLSATSQEAIDNYRQLIKIGNKPDMPTLNYKDLFQEGRHRAIAAKLEGYEYIPVLIIDSPKGLTSRISKLGFSESIPMVTRTKIIPRTVSETGDIIKGIDSLNDAELKVLREELEASGNTRIADSLADVARNEESGLIESLRISGQIRAGSADDARIYSDNLRLQNELDIERAAITRENRRIQEAIDKEREFIANEDRKIRGESTERIARAEDISRVERIDEGERILRIEEPERIEREERLERVEEPTRISRIEEPERIARATETPRITEPPRLNEPPRISEPPRVTELPRINEPPRIKEPPKILRPPILGKGGKELTKEQLLGAIGWKQGIMFKYVYPPYGQEDIINSRTPIEGIPIKEGIRSAYETIIRTRKGTIPPNITRHMGMFDVLITDADKNGQPEIHFLEKEQRKGRGAVAKKATPQAFTIKA